jgi:hypothetical protein
MILLEDAADDRQAQEHAVGRAFEAGRSAVGHRPPEDEPADAEEDEERVLREGLGGPHDLLGEPGELVVRAEVFEDALELRDDEAEEADEQADEDHQDDRRVDEGAGDLALQLDRLLVVLREAVQDGVEDAADLSGLDEVRVELIEDLGVPAQRVAEGHALLDRGLHVREHDGEALIVGLALEDVEALHDGQACVDHGREETREGDEIFRADARAELDVGDVAEIEGLLLDLDRHQAVVPQAVLGRLDRFGLELTLAGLPGSWSACR